MKGRVELVSVMTILLGTVGFAIILMSSEPVMSSVKFHTGDFNRIAEAKLKADSFERRMPLETNYSANIVALDNSANFNGDTWQAGNTKSYSDLKSRYVTNLEREIRTQKQVRWCDAPEGSSVSVTNISKGMEISLSYSDPWVKCESEPVNASVKVSDMTVQNTNNSFLSVLRDASELGKNATEEISRASWTAGTGKGYSDCEEPPVQDPGDAVNPRTVARTNAKAAARGNAGTTQVASLALSSTETYPFISVSPSTSVSFTGGYTQLNIGTTQCTYTTGSQVDSSCSETGSNTGVYECTGEQFEIKYEATPQSVEASFDMETTGSDHKVLNSDGNMEKIDYSFTVKNSSLN